MNAQNIKIRLFFIRLVDWSLLLTVLGIGLPAIFYSEQRPFYAIAVLLGLVLVHRIGDWSLNKIAELQVVLEHMQKRNILHGR